MKTRTRILILSAAIFGASCTGPEDSAPFSPAPALPEPASSAETQPSADRICGSTPVVLEASEIAESRDLSRNTGTPTSRTTKVLAIKTESTAWATRCPVQLTVPHDYKGEGCEVKKVFTSASTLSISASTSRAGEFDLELTSVAGHDGTLKSELMRVPVPGKEPETWHTGWLKTSSNPPPLYDFYIYFGDVRKDGKNQKFYIVEAFDRSDQNCDSHRPDQALCKHTDGWTDEGPGKECEESISASLLDPAAQTHTGSGNETSFP